MHNGALLDRAVEGSVVDVRHRVAVPARNGEMRSEQRHHSAWNWREWRDEIRATILAAEGGGRATRNGEIRAKMLEGGGGGGGGTLSVVLTWRRRAASCPGGWTAPRGAGRSPAAAFPHASSPVHTHEQVNKPARTKTARAKTAGRKQPGRKQPGRKQPGRKQPGRKQPGRKQPGRKSSSRKVHAVSAIPLRCEAGDAAPAPRGTPPAHRHFPQNSHNSKPTLHSGSCGAHGLSSCGRPKRLPVLEPDRM
eukprot:COSAG04_NODE_131_length_24280_cov_40.563418_7_plen_250_part_00